MLEKYRINRSIICIDFKSFYASVECVSRGLDPFKSALVVADRSRGKGALCLAVSPYLKMIGVPSRVRIFDIPDKLKDTIIYAKPRIETYMKTTIKLVEFYLSMFDKNDIYVYSIDEAFLDVTNYLKYYSKDVYSLALDIVKGINELTKLPVSVGIGPNMLLAKLAMDIESKHCKNSIAMWGYEDVETKLWEVTPLSKMWGIGDRMERNLNLLSMFKVGDIANSDINILKDSFGIIGEELWYHANGIDMSLISDKSKLKTVSKSYGSSQVLFHDYSGDFFCRLFFCVSKNREIVSAR